MTGRATIRIVAVLFVATGVAACQEPLSRQSPKPKPEQSWELTRALPDAPSPQVDARSQSVREELREKFSADRLPATELRNEASAAHFDLGHFQMRPQGKQSPDPLAKLFFPASPNRATIYRAQDEEAPRGLMGRAIGAASSLVVAHDDSGRTRLNTPYLLRVLAYAAADSARTPYWRRSAAQPATDFGSTIGNDAGMKVFHEFEPGIMQLVKTHQPKFIGQIAQHFSKK